MLQVTTWSRAWHTSFLAEPGCLASSESACPFCLATPGQGGDVSAYVCNGSQKKACFK